MATKDKNKGRWYVRQGEHIRGPFPNQLISSYLILGRLDLATEVSQDQKNWAPVTDYPALVPDVVLNANSPEGHKALMLARIREDERRSRMQDQEDELDERRVDEDQIVKLHRQLRDDILKRYRTNPELSRRHAMIIIGIAIVLLLILMIYRPSGDEVSADCSALARPGVNWSGCNKQGQNLTGLDLSNAIFISTRLNGVDLVRSRLDSGDLSYSNLSQADLQQATLRGAKLKGANLRMANLQGANLQGADFSYAELEGARLEGANLNDARFENAIWINGEKCLPGSVGACLLPK